MVKGPAGRRRVEIGQPARGSSRPRLGRRQKSSNFDTNLTIAQPASEHRTVLPHQHPAADSEFPAAEVARDVEESVEEPCLWEAHTTKQRQRAEQLKKDDGEGELAIVTGGSLNTQF